MRRVLRQEAALFEPRAGYNTTRGGGLRTDTCEAHYTLNYFDILQHLRTGDALSLILEARRVFSATCLAARESSPRKRALAFTAEILLCFPAKLFSSFCIPRRSLTPRRPLVHDCYCLRACLADTSTGARGGLPHTDVSNSGTGEPGERAPQQRRCLLDAFLLLFYSRQFEDKYHGRSE